METVDENEAKTKPTLDTVVEMLKSLQVEVAAIKVEQNRQARQLDNMAQDLHRSASDMHRFASELYELRLEFHDFREAVTNALPQIAK